MEHRALWTQMEQDAVNLGETPWISLETPKRPPMLPLFGKVRAFLFDSLTLVNTIRPVAPPSTTSAQFQQELNEIYEYSKNLTRDQMRIALFWADGIGTTPTRSLELYSIR